MNRESESDARSRLLIACFSAMLMLTTTAAWAQPTTLPPRHQVAPSPAPGSSSSGYPAPNSGTIVPAPAAFEEEKKEALVPAKTEAKKDGKASPHAGGKADAKPGDKKAAGGDGGLEGDLEFKNFNRSPGSVLRALAEHAAVKPDAKPDKSVAILQEFILRGDWQALTKTIAKQPGDKGPALYGAVVTGLTQSEADVTLLLDDVLSLSDASPKELSPENLSALGTLCQKALQHSERPERFLKRIDAGTRWLGGRERPKRLSAAQLLLQAGLVAEAAHFLPSPNEILASGNAKLMNLFASYLEMAASKSNDPNALAVAFAVTQQILTLPKLEPSERDEAIQRSLKLLPVLREHGVDWIRGQLTAEPAMSLQVLSIVANNHIGPGPGDPGTRLETMAMIKQFGEQLVALHEQQPEGSTLPIKMLTILWMREAELSVNMLPQMNDQPNSYAMQQQLIAGMQPRAIPGGSYFPQQVSAQWQNLQSTIDPNQSNSERNRPKPLPAAELLKLSPGDAWCGLVEAELGIPVLCLKGNLAALAGDRRRTLKFARQLAALGNETAPTLIAQLIQRWPTTLQSDELSELNVQSSNSSGQAIPLTRANQVRRLGKLVELLKEIRSTQIKGDFDAATLQAFAACHSQAEVYQLKDIEAVFGPLKDFSPSLAASIADAMRANLSGMWSRPDVQSQNNTNRTPEEQVAEVRRGYELALQILDGAIQRQPDKIDLHIALAAIRFDQAEFLFSQVADLKTYTQRRDGAYAEYARAAEIYTKTLQSGKPESPQEMQIALYLRWFTAALGASDLSALTPDSKPRRDQFQRIAASLRGLPGPLADAHLQLFAENILQNGSSTPSQLKPWCFRQALRVLGDHPSGKPLRNVLRYYDELLAEIELGADLDRVADVGANHPFGLRLGLRASKALMRESNNFANLLTTMNMYGYGTPANDPKDKIKAMLKEQLADRYEIDLIQFHDPAMPPRAYGRDGWLEKPLAYVVLRARNRSVDRLPPLHVDLEFGDGRGSVLLPVASRALLLSAAKQGASPPLSDIKIKQVFDERAAGDGAWQLEVKASAVGLVTDLDQVLKLSKDTISGFTVGKIDAAPISIAGFDLSQKQPRPTSQRSWVVHLTPASQHLNGQFAFPAAAQPVKEMGYQRYEDFDVVDAGPIVTLKETYPGRHALPGGKATWAALAGLLAVLSGAGVLLWSRRKPTVVAAPAYRRPSAVTPFNLMALLRRIAADDSLQLSEAERSSLDGAVAQLENRYFRREHAGDVDLAATLDRWLARAIAPASPRVSA